jgi:hypothetical protein
MPDSPSIKGAAIAKLIADVHECLGRDEATRARLEAGLSAETLEMLERKIELGNWYPIAQYDELTELIWRELGDRRPDYLRQRGVDLMVRLMEGGMYQQLEFVKRMEGESSRRASRESILGSCRMIGSVTGAIRNFGQDTWEWSADDPNIMHHHTREASAVSEAMCLVSEGSETYLVQLTRPSAPPVRARRLAPDHILYVADYTGGFEG